MDEARLEILFAALAEGDRDAETTLFGELWGRLLGIVRNRGIQGPDAEDVVQETLKAVFLNLRKGQFRQESTRSTWIIGILRRKIADHFERTGPQARLVYDNEADTALDVQANQPIRVEAIRLLRGLTPRQRVVLLGTEIFGWTHAELASRLDCPMGTIASTKSRAIDKLRSLLSGTPLPSRLLADGESHDE